MPKFLSDSIIIAWMNTLPFLRNPFLIIGILALGFFPLFIIITAGGVAAYGFIGTIIVGISGAGLGIAADVVYNRDWLKFQDMLVSSPVHPLSYAFGISLSALVQALPVSLIFISLAVVSQVLPITSLLSVAMILLLTWASMTMLGFTLATYMKSREIGTASTMLGLMLSYLPPVYYPITAVPEYLRWVTFLVPTTHSAELLRGLGGLADLDWGSAFFHWIALFIFTIVFLVFTLKGARWRQH